MKCDMPSARFSERGATRNQVAIRNAKLIQIKLVQIDAAKGARLSNAIGVFVFVVVLAATARCEFFDGRTRGYNLAYLFVSRDLGNGVPWRLRGHATCNCAQSSALSKRM